MTKSEVVRLVVGEPRPPVKAQGAGTAPANIALCKYWGKRDPELNLPMTSSLSLSLGPLGSTTTVAAAAADCVWLNEAPVAAESAFFQRLVAFLDLFRPAADFGFEIRTTNTVPTAAGVASSASGFAALTLALDDFFGWQLDRRLLSILARLGSGSACRSLFDGFVEWHAGDRADGLDSCAEPLQARWPDLRLGIVTVSTAAKPLGSRQAMQQTMATTDLYRLWPTIAAGHLSQLETAICEQEFAQLGRAAEQNAMTMHALMHAAWPPIVFWLPETVATIHRVRQLRADGVGVYLTIDAGPNVKLLFLAGSAAAVAACWPRAQVVAPFTDA